VATWEVEESPVGVEDELVLEAEELCDVDLDDPELL